MDCMSNNNPYSHFLTLGINPKPRTKADRFRRRRELAEREKGVRLPQSDDEVAAAAEAFDEVLVGCLKVFWQVHGLKEQVLRERREVALYTREEMPVPRKEELEEIALKEKQLKDELKAFLHVRDPLSLKLFLGINRLALEKVEGLRREREQAERELNARLPQSDEEIAAIDKEYECMVARLSGLYYQKDILRREHQRFVARRDDANLKANGLEPITCV